MCNKVPDWTQDTIIFAVGQIKDYERRHRTTSAQPNETYEQEAEIVLTLCRWDWRSSHSPADWESLVSYGAQKMGDMFLDRIGQQIFEDKLDGRRRGWKAPRDVGGQVHGEYDDRGFDADGNVLTALEMAPALA